MTTTEAGCSACRTEHDMRRRYRYYMVLLRALRALTDFSVVYASFFAGFHVYFWDKPPGWVSVRPELSPMLYYIPSPQYRYMTIAFALACMVVAVFAFYRLYEEDTSILHVKEYRRVLIGFLVAVIIFLATYYIWFGYTGPGIREKLFSRRIFGYSCMLGLNAIIVARVVFNHVQYMLHRRGIGARRVLIYGAGTSGRSVAKRLAEFPAFGLLAVGFVDDNASLANSMVMFDPARSSSLPVLGTGARLDEHVKRAHADQVLIAIPGASTAHTVTIVEYCLAHDIPFQFIPNMCQLAFQRTIMRDIAGIPVISIREISRRYIYTFCKRVFDLVVGAVALILLAPLMLALALIIRLSSPGPALFVQDRTGLNGVPFRMLKFRTMHRDAKQYELTPLTIADPRITRLGRWLRRSSLDELPQLFNVLAGSMSLVGPRPEMPFIVAQYNDLQRMRLKVKPGITGLWQLSADRRLAIHENMDYDLFYIHEQSFLLDVAIMVQTVFFAFRGI